MTRMNDVEEGLINGWLIGADGVARLGTVGIFTGIVMAVVAVQLYRLCVKTTGSSKCRKKCLKVWLVVLRH